MTNSRVSKEISLYMEAAKKWKEMPFKPVCDDHKPEASLDTNEDGTCVVIHCKNCGFTAWMHPDAYKEMMEKNK